MNFFAGSVVTEAWSTVHRAQLVLEVADALVDGEWPVLVPASSSGRSGGQQGASGGIAGLSARGLPIACPTTARRASTAPRHGLPIACPVRLRGQLRSWSAPEAEERRVGKRRSRRFQRAIGRAWPPRTDGGLGQPQRRLAKSAQPQILELR